FAGVASAGETVLLDTQPASIRLLIPTIANIRTFIILLIILRKQKKHSRFSHPHKQVITPVHYRVYQQKR
ncbi:MAG: hypothetical protein ACTMHW_13465, partial [Hafnia alvei]